MTKKRAPILSKRLIPVLLCLVMALAMHGLYGCTEAGTAETAGTTFVAVEPAGDVRNEQSIRRDITELTDPAFRKRLDDLVSAVKSEPTNGDNIQQRLPVLFEYFDALQLNGVLLNWRIITELNRALKTINAGRMTGGKERDMKLYDHRLAEMRLAEELQGRTGRFLLKQPSEPVLQAKRYTTVTLVYVTDTPIAEGARMRIGRSWYTDLGGLQSKRALQPNYYTVKCSNPDVELLTGYRAWYGNNFTGLSGGHTPHVIIKRGNLEKGDRLEFVFGDRSGGGPGWMIQSMSGEAELRIEVDFRADGVFVPIGQPRFMVVGNDADHIRVVAPTVAHAGDRFLVKASVEDRFYNRAGNPPESLVLWRDDAKIAEAGPVDNDPATFHFENISLPKDQQAPAYFRVTAPDPSLYGESNPVIPTPDDQPYVYWGELHGHGGYTDANCSPQWYMNYAKNVAFLDFASHTDHDIFLSEVHFRDIFRVNEAFHSPEEGFVTIRAYEWTNSPVYGGHHNVFYLDDSQRVIPTAYGYNLEEMYRLQKKWNDPDKVLIIPHAHAPGDWNVKGWAQLVEIYAQHGSFEWFGRQYLQKGHRIGFNAASDCHLGHPGNSPSRGKTRGGLTAVFADSLQREPIFRNLKSRHTYGTSIARMYLKTDIHGAAMGDDVVIDRAAHPEIRLTGFAAGTAPLARIAAVVNSEDAVVKDYLEAGPVTRTLRFRLHRASKPTDPDASRLPQRHNRYWGRVIVGGVNLPEGNSRIGTGNTVIASMTPLGIDGYEDFQSHTGKREATFTWRLRGDHDGMLLTLDRFDPKDTLTLIVYTSSLFDTEYWNIQEQPRLPGEFRHAGDLPRKKVVLMETVGLGDLMTDGWSKGFDEVSRADLRMVTSDRPKYRSFEFTLGRDHGLKEGKDNHVYVRVEQLDDQMAWSSPTFIEWR